jgi:hypothetical protein
MRMTAHGLPTDHDKGEKYGATGSQAGCGSASRLFLRVLPPLFYLASLVGRRLVYGVWRSEATGGGAEDCAAKR